MTTSQHATVVAVDVGGTGIKAATVDGAGVFRARSQRPTPVRDGTAAVVDAIAATVAALADESVVAVSVVVPGVVDAAQGVARYSANIGWRDVPLRQLLAAQLRVPISLGHDVSAAGLAERTVGRARGTANSLVLVIGTGIAGVIVSDGQPMRGGAGLAGEFGHAPVHPGGEPCACGQRGCLETYASAAAIARRYRAAGGSAALGAREIVAVLDTDPIARQVWDEATDALAIGLAGGVAVLDPELIVLGGGLAVAGEALRGRVADALGRHLVWRAPPPVELSTLGADAGQVGAAILGWQLAGRVDFGDWELR